MSGTTQVTVGTNDKADHVNDLIVTFFDVPGAPGTDAISADGTRTLLPGDAIGLYEIAPSTAPLPGCVVTLPATGPVTSAPPQAASVGYTLLTYGPAVTLGSMWWGLSGANVVQNADGSFTDFGGMPNNYNAHISTAIGTTGDSSGTIRGVAFGNGGYFELTFSWANPPVVSNIDDTGNPDRGWPSFWSTTAEHDFTYLGDLPNRQNLELDTYEALGPTDQDFNCGIIAWWDDSPSDQFSNNNTGQPGGTRSPAGTDVTMRHKMGFLWVPATATTQGYVRSYFDDVQVGNTYVWDQFTGGSIPGQPGSPTFSCMDAGRRRIWVGTGTPNPMTVYAFRVWQKDASGNVGGA
jgi:hypothetical protein